MERNSYLSIARENLEYAEGDFMTKRYRSCCIYSQQAAELYLKSVFELTVPNAEPCYEMRTHSLKAILLSIKELLPALEFLKYDLTILGNFYSNLSYPGSDFAIADEDDAQLALRTARLVMKACERFHSNYKTIGLIATNEFGDN